MKRAIAALTLVSLASSGCAVRGAAAGARARAWESPIARMAGTAGQRQVRGAEAWKAYARTIPPGTKVKVATSGGTNMKAVLMSADDSGITIARRTRIPEPPLAITYDSLATLEIDNGAPIGRTIVVAALAAAATTLGILFLLIVASEN